MVSRYPAGMPESRLLPEHPRRTAGGAPEHAPNQKCSCADTKQRRLLGFIPPLHHPPQEPPEDVHAQCETTLYNNISTY